MRIIWLLLSVWLAVAYSENQEEIDLEDDVGLEEFGNLLEEIMNDLDDDDEFSEFESQDELEDVNSEEVLNELLAKFQEELGVQDDPEIGAFEDELTGLLSGLISGTIG